MEEALHDIPLCHECAHWHDDQSGLMHGVIGTKTSDMPQFEDPLHVEESRMNADRGFMAISRFSRSSNTPLIEYWVARTAESRANRWMPGHAD